MELRLLYRALLYGSLYLLWSLGLIAKWVTLGDVINRLPSGILYPAKGMTNSVSRTADLTTKPL